MNKYIATILFCICLAATACNRAKPTGGETGILEGLNQIEGDSL